MASTGTAVAATGQLVNIADGVNAARLAKVDAVGKLAVGDGSGPLTVDGTTTEAAPSTHYHGFAAPGINNTCVALQAAPAGKALIIKTVIVDVYSAPEVGIGHTVSIYQGGTNSCTNWVIDMHPAGLGPLTLPFEPGLAVPAGQRLWVKAKDMWAEVHAYGYTVPASAVPAP